MYAGWLLGLSAFALGARYGGGPGGGLCLGLTLLSGAYEFDTEARGYALMTMFGGLAAAVWVYLRHQIRGSRVLVSLLLAGATMSHYYGVFLALPFVFAEAGENPRRICGLLLPMSAPILAIAASLPVLRGAQTCSCLLGPPIVCCSGGNLPDNRWRHPRGRCCSILTRHAGAAPMDRSSRSLPGPSRGGAMGGFSTPARCGRRYQQGHHERLRPQVCFGCYDRSRTARGDCLALTRRACEVDRKGRPRHRPCMDR